MRALRAAVQLRTDAVASPLTVEHRRQASQLAWIAARNGHRALRRAAIVDDGLVRVREADGEIGGGARGRVGTRAVVRTGPDRHGEEGARERQDGPLPVDVSHREPNYARRGIARRLI